MSRVFGKDILEELAKYVTNSDLYFSDFRSWEEIIIKLKFGLYVDISTIGPYSRDSNQKQRSYDFFVLTETTYMMNFNSQDNVGLYNSLDHWMNKYGVSKRLAIMMKILNEGSGGTFLNCPFNIKGIYIGDLLFLMDRRGILE